MKDKMEFTCIMCPVGCTLVVNKKDGEITVTGNACPRGEEYGKKEVTSPERIVTTVKKYKNGTICLKTNTAVPKKLVDEVLKTIAKTRATKSYNVGDIFINNILGTQSDIVVTQVNLDK